MSLGFFGGQAYGFGFGEPEVSSALGQPLRMRVALQPDPSVDLSPQCLHLLGDPHDPLPTLTAAKLSIEEAGAARFLHIDSTSAVDEPILRVVVDAGCVQHVRREFTILLDPPVAQPVAAAPAAPFAPILAASLSATSSSNVAPPDATIASELATGKTLDLGVARVHGRVGEALAMEIPITGSAAADLDNSAVHVAQILASDGAPLHNAVQTSLTRSDTRTLLQLVTNDAVAEPALRVVIEVAAGNVSVRREYGVLLDMPATPAKAVAEPAPAASAPAAPESNAAAEAAMAATDAAPAPRAAPVEAAPPAKPAKRKHAHHAPKLPSPAATAEAPVAAPPVVANARSAAPEPKEQAPSAAAATAEPAKGTDHLQLTAPVDDAAVKRFAEMDRRVQDLTQEIVKLRNDLAVQKQREADLVAEGARPGGNWIVALVGGIAVLVGGLLLWTRRRGGAHGWNPGSWETATQFGAGGGETVGPLHGDSRIAPATSMGSGQAAAPAAEPAPSGPLAGAAVRPPAPRRPGRAGNTVGGADPITISPLTTPIEVTEVLANEPSIEQLYTLFYDVGSSTAPGGKLPPGKSAQPGADHPAAGTGRPESLDLSLGIPDSVASPRAVRAQGAMKVSSASPSGSISLPPSPPAAPAFSYTGNALPGHKPEPGKLDVATNVGPLTEIPRDGDFPKTQPGLDLDLSTQPGLVTRFGPATELPRDTDAPPAAATPPAPAALDLDLTTNIGRVTELGPMTEIPRDQDEPATQVALDLNLNTNVAEPGDGEGIDRESDPFAITTIPGASKNP